MPIRVERCSQEGREKIQWSAELARENHQMWSVKLPGAEQRERGAERIKETDENAGGCSQQPKRKLSTGSFGNAYQPPDKSLVNSEPIQRKQERVESQRESSQRDRQKVTG